MEDDNRRIGDRRDTKKQKLPSSADEPELTEGKKVIGWLVSFTPSPSRDAYAVFLDFVCEGGRRLQLTMRFRPYFYVATKDKMETDVEGYLKITYRGQIADIQIVEKEFPDFKNQKTYLKISFDTEQQLMQVKGDLMHVVKRNKEKSNAEEAHAAAAAKSTKRNQDFSDCIVYAKGCDEPYHVRFAIDYDIRCGLWYDVSKSSGDVTIKRSFDTRPHATPRVCAFDINTTKLPGCDRDLLLMISYIVDGKGYMIMNKEFFGPYMPEDVTYDLQPIFKGRRKLTTLFKTRTAENERQLIEWWISHMTELMPAIYVTYNSSKWPGNWVLHHGLAMDDYLNFACRLDCFDWVKRDVFLPRGIHDLKAVVEAQLFYVPEKVDAEDSDEEMSDEEMSDEEMSDEEMSDEEMTLLPLDKSKKVLYDSASDVVLTYNLYADVIHFFIFNLTTIIPMPPHEVIREDSIKLCTLLPDKFRLLYERFVSMINALEHLKSSSAGPFLSAVSSVARDSDHLFFSHKHLAQIKYIFPEAVITKKYLCNNAASCIKTDIKILVSSDVIKGQVEETDTEEAKLSGLRCLFCSKLLYNVGIHAMVPDYDVPQDDTTRMI